MKSICIRIQNGGDFTNFIDTYARSSRGGNLLQHLGMT